MKFVTYINNLVIIIYEYNVVCMNAKQNERLGQLLDKRRQKLESINYFGEYFEEFSYSILKNTVNDINFRISEFNNEVLRIFYENPYENKRSRFYVMVQLVSNHHRRNSFYLDNISNFPTISFDGDEFTGTVMVRYNFENKINKKFEYDISNLKNEETVIDILLDFLDKIYSL